MPTTNFNLPLYGPTDTAALDTLLNGQSNAMDAALLSTTWRLGGTDAARLALSGARLKEGLEWRTTDTDRDWYYNGSAWQLNDEGLYLITPTSVANGTVSGGATTFTGVTSVSLNGVFSSRFTDYLIRFRFTGTQNRGSLRLRNAGTDNTGGTDYKNQYLYNSGDAALTTSYEQTSQWWTAAGTGNRQTSTIQLFYPAQAQATDIINESITIANATISALNTRMGGQHISTSTFDGFTLASSSGNFAGTIRGVEVAR